MQEQTLDFSEYLSALKRRRLSIVVIAVVVFVIGALTALLWPPTYSSSATILIKEQDIPPELVRSTVTSFASQRIQAISQRVMARPNLLEIIDKYNLYQDEKVRLTTEEIVSRMRENIGLNMIDAEVVDPRSGRPTSATIAFQLTFSGEDPAQVQKVTNELMSLYLKENLRERSEQASETYVFLKQEAEGLRADIAKYEKEITAFKEENATALPELTELNQRLLNRTEDELSEAESQIQAISERKIFLQSQLSQLKPFGDDINLDPVARLQALKTEYLRLIARYSPDHPDVIRTKNEIHALEVETGAVDSSAMQMQELEALRAQLASARKQYSEEHPDVVKLKRQISALESTSSATLASTSKLASAARNNPNNPAYIQLQTQIEAADAEIRGLKEKQGRLKEKLAEYESRLTKMPQVESEYRLLTRDLDDAMTKYEDTRAKLRQAEIGRELEKGSKGERFVIVEPPILPEEPVSPNRPAILFLSFVLALGFGVGYAAVAENLDSSMRGSKSIAAALGAAPLAVIPYLENDTEVSRRKRRLITRTAAAFGAVIIAIAMLHYFWTPLDVLWYKAMRKADIVINT